MGLAEAFKGLTHRKRTLLLAALCLVLIVVYLSCMPSLIDVAALLGKAVAKPQGVYGYILHPPMVRNLSESTVPGGSVISRFGYSITIPDSLGNLKTNDEQEENNFFQIGDGKTITLHEPGSRSMREYYRDLDALIKQKYGVSVEQAFGVDFDTEYQCYRFTSNLWAGSFSLFNDRKNRVALDLLAIHFVKGHDKTYRLDQGTMKGFLGVFEYPGLDDQASIQARYIFFREDDLNRAHSIDFHGDYNLSQILEIIQTIRFDGAQ